MLQPNLVNSQLLFHSYNFYLRVRAVSLICIIRSANLNNSWPIKIILDTAAKLTSKYKPQYSSGQLYQFGGTIFEWL